MSTVDHDSAEEFGPYLVYERLGMGGMATVHRAKKRGIAGFERGVALKRLLPHLAEDQEFIESFVREAKLASMLVHPNIAQIYDLGRVGSAYYITMEHVEGIDVRKILRYARRSGEVIPLPVALSIIAELCDALEYAHTYVDEEGQRMGIVHRDVSPSNLIVSNSGHLKVIDFGIAKATTRQLNTETGRIKGKLGYLSPEAAVGKSYGPPSDVFSAAVVAFELLTTHPLFWAKNDYETLLKIHHAEVPPPSRINPAVPHDLDRVVLQALERSAADRTQSAGELRVDIDRIASRYGFRLSSRVVFDWLSGVSSESWATLKPAPRSLSQQQAAQAAAQLRPLPLPPPPEPQLTTRSTSSGRSTSIAHAAALAEAGHALGAGGGLVTLVRSAEDDLIAELAWGSDGQSYPFLVEMSGKLERSGSSASLELRPPSPVRRWALPVGVVTLLVAVVAAGAMLMRAAPVHRVPPVGTRATLNFAVQPNDAEIEIGTGIRPDAARKALVNPGAYSIAIRREGYEPWSTNMTVVAGVVYEIGVSLRPERTGADSSSGAGDVEPEELIAAASVGAGQDGAGAGQNSAGAGQDSAVSSVGVGAPQEASPRAMRERNPTLMRREPRTFPRPPAVAAGAVDAGVPPGNDPGHAGGLVALLDAGLGEASGSATAPVGRAGAASASTAPGDAGAGALHASSASAAARSGAPLAQPSPPRTPMVSASAVTKLSGTIPELRVNGRGEDLSDVLAKLCIDELGQVTSVQLVRATAEIAGEVQRSLQSWRYKPYLAQGRPSPACFAMPMRVVVVSSS